MHAANVLSYISHLQGYYNYELYKLWLNNAVMIIINYVHMTEEVSSGGG